MAEIFVLFLAIFTLMAGSILGYLARQSIAKRQADTLELTLHKRLSKAKVQADEIIDKAKKKARRLIDQAEERHAQLRKELSKTERFLRKKESSLEEKDRFLTQKEKQLEEKVEKLRQIKTMIESARKEVEEKLEKISGLSKEEAKKEILANLEKEYEKEILEKMSKLEREGEERFETRAKEILASTIQRYALSQAQELTTTTVNLPNDEVKGRIIGKEGRNIKVLERLTGTEIVVDDTPETVIISGFNPVRRQIAKTALAKLIRDGRIQPARIEKEVERAKEEVSAEIKKAGEQAIFHTGVLGLNPNLIQLLGRLHFRTSYSQNVLLHSIEVSQLAAALAAELGADVEICKRAGLLHDIGKSIDHQVEGSHVEIGIKILEKFGESKEVIDAMKSHHGDYESKTVESIIVQVADQISGARPGARKESLDEYLKRLENLEKIAQSFKGVKESYAIQAGRELRVFVKPEKVSDLEAHRIAKGIVSKIQEELRYPGEIKVTVIREKRIVEHAR
jgi:ribonuclease Y